MPIPTHDGGLEHTAAAFDDASVWLTSARAGKIILFPPQVYLLTLVSYFLTGPSSAPSPALDQPSCGPPADDLAADPIANYKAQRAALLSFLSRTPTSRLGNASNAKPHPTANIPWAEKVICPTSLFMCRSDGRVVLGLDKPGPELRESERGGDGDRVVLVTFSKSGAKDADIRWRADVLQEEKRAEMVEREPIERLDGKGQKL
jgi:hypothetical protein